MGAIEASDRAWKVVQMKGENTSAAEWLRGIIGRYEDKAAYLDGSCSIMAGMFGIVCKEETCQVCMTKMMTAIADRIDAERALPEGMERPRFEDGEPVRIGDELEFEGKAMLVCDATFYADGWALWCDREDMSGRLYGKYGERVKRPTPKVLDADGAPIEVGDVVYYDGEPHPLTVVGITRDGKDALVDANGEESCVEGGRPQDFSHDAPKPVLDADGVPIEVGDTVYLRSNGREGKVVGFYEDKGETWVGERWVSVSYELGSDRMTVDTEGKALTHERPDSWERIEEDAKLAPRDYLEKRGMNPEKTERIASMMADLVRRAKALAKAGEVE